MKIARILLVDDDPYVRRVSEIALAHSFACEVKTASCGQQALDIIAEFTPGLVLLDLSMPEMDGIEVLERLNRTKTKAPVIVLSASVSESERSKILSLGARGIIIKPFDPMKLAETINSMLPESAESD